MSETHSPEPDDIDPETAARILAEQRKQLDRWSTEGTPSRPDGTPKLDDTHPRLSAFEERLLEGGAPYPRLSSAELDLLYPAETTDTTREGDNSEDSDT